MEEIINNLINCTEKEEILEELNKFIYNIEKLNSEEKQLAINLLNIKAKYKLIELEKQKEYLESNVYIYEKDIALQAKVLEEIVIDIENEEDFEKCLKITINKFLSKNKNKKSNSKEIEPEKYIK